MAAAPRFARRLQKELQDLKASPPEGVKVVEASNLDEWILELEGSKDTLFEGEKFQLRFRFKGFQYPMESPEVVFIGNAPMHPHIYSNGHICLDLLYDNWSPAMSVSSTCISLLSMLSSCPNKARPEDNDRYVARIGGQTPKKTQWWFHDDTV